MVPSDYWTGRHCFTKDTVEAGSLRMEAVRLVATDWIDGAQTKRPTRQDARPGPKSRRRLIRETLGALIADGVLQPNDPQKVMVHEIRTRILQDHPDIPPEGRNGLSDATIRQVLSAYNSQNSDSAISHSAEPDAS